MESAGAAQGRQKAVDPSVVNSATADTKAVGYGLPCSNCRAYYTADLDVCPICKSRERVSAKAAPPVPVAPVVASPAPSPALEDERERFLKELKSQAFASHTQINAAATFRCVL